MSDIALKYNEVVRIKDLLFGEERRLLTEVKQLVAHHDERIGTDDRLKQSVSHIIALALRDAQINQHEQLAAAISPLVMASVRREILNSRHDLIDAIHPMMGHMMSAYVTNGLRDFLHQTDRRLESGLSPNRWRLRIKSAITGVPVHELILRERKLVKIVDILLLKRGSGVLVDRWQADPETQSGKAGQNPALLSSMLSAITDFSREAFSDGKSELRTLDIGSARIYLRASPAHLVGIKCVGMVSASAERKIDRAVLRAFEDYGDALNADARDGSAVRRVLPALADRLMDALAPEMTDSSVRSGRLRYVVTLASLIGLMGFATAGRHILKSFEASAKQRQIENVISSTEGFKGLPVTVRPSQTNNGFEVTGIAPSREAAIALGRAIQGAVGPMPVALNLATGVVTSTTDLAGDTVNAVTELAGGALDSVFGGANSATTTVLNITGGATNAVAQTVDGVLGATKSAVTQTAGAVEALTRRLGDLEQAAAIVNPDGTVVKLLKPIADLPQKLADVEARIEARANQRSLADLNGRLEALKGQTNLAGGATAIEDTERLKTQVTALQNDIRAVGSRLKAKPSLADGAAPLDEINSLFTKVASAERDVAAAPLKQQVQSLTRDLAVLTSRLDGAPSDERRAAQKGQPKQATLTPVKIDTDIINELNKPLTPDAADLATYSSEAAVRDLASRVKGSVVAPRVTGRPTGAAARGEAQNAANPVTGVVSATQNSVQSLGSATGSAVNSVAGATRSSVQGIGAATGNVVGGVTSTTGGVVNGLVGRR